MRYIQIIEASMPFGKVGNTTGMSFGFESEVIGKAEAFADEDVNFDDEDDLIRELNIDRSDFDTAYQEWLDDDNEGDWEDWINAVGLTTWWKKMDIDSYEYSVVDDNIIRFKSWGSAIDDFAEVMQEELGISQIVTSFEQEETTQNKDYSDWHIEGDGSIQVNDENDIPFEVISPVYYSYEDFVKSLTAYFDYINTRWSDGIYTNNTTGLHINIGMQDAKNKIDPLKLALFSGEKWVAQHWRQDDNAYTNALLPKLDAAGLPRSVKDASAYMRNFIATLDDKSFAINFLTLIERGYVEFRPIGNTNYQNRLPEVLNHISRFIQLIQIASDPTMYAKEYAKKLGMLIGGGQANTTTENMPFDKRLIRKWLDGVKLTKNDKNIIMDEQGNVKINARTLAKLASFGPEFGGVPPQIIKLLIKYGNITREAYIETLQYFSDRGWLSDAENIKVARAILDPYFGVSGDIVSDQ